MNVKDFKEKLFLDAKEKGFSDCEIYFSRSKNFGINIFEGEVKNYTNTDSSGISFRGLYNGTMGYSFSEKVDFDVIDLLINNAMESALIIEDSEKEELYPGDTNYVKLNLYNESLKNVTPNQIINDGKEMEKLTYAVDSRVKSVDQCKISTGESEIYISNTLGLDLKEKSNYVMAYPVARVVEKDETKVNYDVWIGNNYEDLNIKELSKESVRKAISSLGAKTVDSGEYNIVFLNLVFTDLLESFVGIFFAETVQKGFSLLKGKVNEKIASEKINIRDDAHLENMFGSASFDSEGVKTKNKIVVERGILKTFLYNLKSAKKDEVISTGNGFKAGFKSYVSTSATNFYIEKGNTDFENMIKNVKDGILITDVSGLHAGLNPISGDFSLLSEGFLIVDGKITKPVEQIVVTGNFFEMLNNIKDVASDLKFSMPSGVGYFGSPSIFAGKLSVSGS